MAVFRASAAPTPFSWGSRLGLGLCALFLAGCAHAPRRTPQELWIPAQTKADLVLEGREIWIDVELAGYTRQELERYSDYEAERDDSPPPQ